MTAIKITDRDYFFALDNQIRTQMSKFEVEIILPIVNQIFEEHNLEVIEHPIEGYYYKTSLLQEYFNKVRTLQGLPLSITSDSISLLNKFLDNDIFGIATKDSYSKLLVRRFDSMFRAVNSLPPSQWNLTSIIEVMRDYNPSLPNLVELAAVIGDPILLTCGMETNALYRSQVSGSFYCPTTYEWNVSSRVETLGNKIIEEYNKTFNLFGGIQFSIAPIHVNNWDSFVHRPEFPRAAYVGINPFSMTPHYMWIVDKNGKFSDGWYDHVITTKELVENVVV